MRGCIKDQQPFISEQQMKGKRLPMFAIFPRACRCCLLGRWGRSTWKVLCKTVASPVVRPYVWHTPQGNAKNSQALGALPWNRLRNCPA